MHDDFDRRYLERETQLIMSGKRIKSLYIYRYLLLNTFFMTNRNVNIHVRFYRHVHHLPVKLSRILGCFASQIG